MATASRLKQSADGGQVRFFIGPLLTRPRKRMGISRIGTGSAKVCFNFSPFRSRSPGKLSADTDSACMT